MNLFGNQSVEQKLHLKIILLLYIV